MSLNFLDFEQPIAELEAKIDSLTAVSRQDEKLDINIDEEVHRLREKSVELTRKIFADLGAWQIAQLARHPQRPYTLDYVRLAFDEFDELAGDRAYADDKAIVGGIARLDGRPVMIIGHQKGRETKEKIRRNFGMPAPEGYRKALRLMQMAERFKMPIITFIDTPGAYPGVGAEERGQSEAIARNLREMSRLSVPTICTVIGEGGSGGALAIGVGDKVNMLQYSTYSVISPEGCASILWKSADKAPLAAEAMGIIAPRLKELKLIDSIIPEPLGGAHRNPEAMADGIFVVLWGFGSGLHTLELAVVQLGIEAACGQQFVVVALLHDVAVLHHKDHVRLADGGKAVRHNKAGTALHHAGKSFLDTHLGAGINGGGGLVQDQHRRQAEHHAGNAQQLLLALTDVAAVLGDDGVVALGQAADEAVGVGCLGRSHHLVEGGVRLAVGDVLPHGAGSEPGIL